MRVGLWIYGLATVVTGIVDIVWGAFEPSHQPIQALGVHIPVSQILAYIAGAWLVAAGMAILWQRTERIGAAGSAMIYLVFALLWVPRFYTATHQFGFRIGVLMFIFFGIGQQLLLVTPAAIVYAVSASSDPVWRERAAVAAGWTLGLGPIAFGLGHLVRPALGALSGFLGSAYGLCFLACRDCYCLEDSRRFGGETSRPDVVIVRGCRRNTSCFCPAAQPGRVGSGGLQRDRNWSMPDVFGICHQPPANRSKKKRCGQTDCDALFQHAQRINATRYIWRLDIGTKETSQHIHWLVPKWGFYKPTGISTNCRIAI